MSLNINFSTLSPDESFVLEASAMILPFDKEHWAKQSEAIRDQGAYPELLAALPYFEAEHKEVFLLPGEERSVFLLGMGSKPGFSEYLAAFRAFFYRNKKKLPKTVALDAARLEQDDFLVLVEAAINGAYLALYDLALYKTEAKQLKGFLSEHAAFQLVVPSGMKKEAYAAAARGAHVAQAQLAVFDLVNAPANKKTPRTLEDWAIRSGHEHGYRVTTFDHQSMEALGLHALLAVNQGSDIPPAFLILEYKPEVPEGTTLKKVGLVGKGVTFDTGGISIKAAANLHFMKSDMAGGGAVLGAMEAAARLKLPVHLVAIVPSTPNDVGPKAVKPGDVIGSYAGKTIEVIDTDAEGRLVLADGLAYLNRNFKPDVIIDLATLTGSCVATFGYVCAGLFTQNDALAAALETAGKKTGERVWRLPIWEQWASETKSDIADLKNHHGKPVAGAIVAAKFLEVFVENHPAWAHLDMAGVAIADSEFSSMRAATAWGVRLLVEYLQQDI